MSDFLKGWHPTIVLIFVLVVYGITGEMPESNTENYDPTFWQSLVFVLYVPYCIWAVNWLQKRFATPFVVMHFSGMFTVFSVLAEGVGGWHFVNIWHHFKFAYDNGFILIM